MSVKEGEKREAHNVVRECNKKLNIFQNSHSHSVYTKSIFKIKTFIFLKKSSKLKSTAIV